MSGFPRIFAVVLALCVFTPATARAALITIESLGGAGETNTGVSGSIPLGQQTVVTDPTTRPLQWFSTSLTAQWVSFLTNASPSSPGLFSNPVDNPSDPIFNNNSVLFRHVFSLPTAPSFSAILRVLADDTVTVRLNGQTLATASGPFSPSGNTYLVCSDVTIGCLQSTMGLFNIGGFLQPGQNILEFEVFQRRGSGYGLNYSTDIQPVPEPGSLLLLGSGLAALGTAMRRRRRTSQLKRARTT